MHTPLCLAPSSDDDALLPLPLPLVLVTPPPCCCRHAAEVLLGAALSVKAPPTLSAIFAHFVETTAKDGPGADQQIDALARMLFQINFKSTTTMTR